jgi:phosphohistidine phosphatase
MLLYLVRHAIAVKRGDPAYLNDDERPLTPIGIKKMRTITRALSKLGVAPVEIWTSPLVRARETAEILTEELPHTPAIRTVKELAPGGSYDQLFEKLGKNLHLDEIALVGHEPDMGELATRCMVGTMAGSVRFKKGGVACIEMDDVKPPVRGELLWLLTPKQMTKIA